MAVSAALYTAPNAQAANGSNYIHLMNGVDYFILTASPPIGLQGIWRCFPGDMLCSPTLDISAGSPTFGTYATKIDAIHITVTGSPGSILAFPTIALTSSAGKCNILTSAGTVNYGLFSVVGFGTIIGGPLTGNAGPVPVTLNLGVAGAAIANPAGAPNIIVQLALILVGALGQPYVGIAASADPDGAGPLTPTGSNSVTLWTQQDTVGGPGLAQYWTTSADEKNLCSNYSWLLSAGFAFLVPSTWEWSIGLGTLDATLAMTVSSNGPGPSGLNAHDAVQGFTPGFDQGVGSRTISITNSGVGTETLGMAVYDMNNIYGGAFRLGVANIMGLNTPVGTPTCDSRAPTFVVLPLGGAGGPVLAGAILEKPRSVGKIDTLATALLANGVWIASTNHSTAPGSMNIPWFPAVAGISGSNATGSNGGFVIPIPPFPTLPGIQLLFWNWAVDGTNTFLDHGGNGGHSLTNGYPSQFFP
jgi:hypothetical protein